MEKKIRIERLKTFKNRKKKMFIAVIYLLRIIPIYLFIYSFNVIYNSIQISCLNKMYTSVKGLYNTQKLTSLLGDSSSSQKKNCKIIDVHLKILFFSAIS